MPRSTNHLILYAVRPNPLPAPHGPATVRGRSSVCRSQKIRNSDRSHGRDEQGKVADHLQNHNHDRNPPKSASSPTITNAGTPERGTIPGRIRCRNIPNAPPTNPPMSSHCTKTPPLLPDPIVRDVVRVLKIGRRMRNENGSML